MQAQALKPICNCLFLKENLIYNCGTLCGKTESILALSDLIFACAVHSSVHIACQASYNYIIQSGMKYCTKFTDMSNGWAVQCGTVENTERMHRPDSMFAEKILEKPPVLKDGLICNTDGIPFHVVHQYQHSYSFRERIADLIKNRKVDGVSEVRDESDRRGMRIVLELRRGAAAAVVLNNLYKQTPLRNSFSVNMIGLVAGTPRVLTLKQTLRHYIEFRQEVVRRRAEFDHKKASARLHVLEGLRTAIENLDRVIEIIRGSDDVESARNNLINEFTLSEIQAQAILDMQLRRLAALEREKIENEYKTLQELIASLEELLGDPSKIDAVVREETLEMREKHGQKRIKEQLLYHLPLHQL